MEELQICHQCRQRTKNFVAICKNQKEGKHCKLKFCQRCLLNRYGEKAEEVDRLNNWNCPKCRNECNCSVCLKRKGHKPTGNLVRAAKAGGYSSVSQMLAVKGEEILESVSASNEVATTTSEKEIEAAPSREQGRQESPPDSVKKPKKTKRKHKEKAKWTSNFMSLKAFQEDANEERVIKEAVKEQTCQSTVVIDDDDNLKSEDIFLPPGTVLTEILDIEFAPENVGNVLQFLEFCKTFGEVIDVKKDEAEAILRQLVHKHNLRRGDNYLVTQFQTRLLTLILSESGNGSPSFSPNDGKNSWFEALVKLISRSDLALKELQLGSLMEGIEKYYELDLSKRLRLLNFLCDEAVGTEKLRSFIDDQNSKFFEDMKEAKAKVAAATEKEKSLKQKSHDEEAKANVSENKDTVPTSEKKALLSQMRSEAAEAHTEMIEAKGMVPKRKQRSNALRTEPVFLDSNGQRFWKLKSYGDEEAFFMQEIKIEVAVEERWFVYGTEKKHEIEMYISSRAKKAKKSKIQNDDYNSESNIDGDDEIQNHSCTLTDDCSEANMAEKPEILNDYCTPTDDNSKANM